MKRALVISLTLALLGASPGHAADLPGAARSSHLQQAQGGRTPQHVLQTAFGLVALISVIPTLAVCEVFRRAAQPPKAGRRSW
jgi:hypothetical protein